MSEAEGKSLGAAKTTQTSLLDAVLAKGFRAKTDDQKTEAKKDIEALVREVTKGIQFGSKKVDQSIEKRIQAIDATLSSQLAAIMHHPDFQRLEGSWRGLSYLVHGTNTSQSLKIKVLNASKSELQADQEDASEFDQTALFKQIYESEYGTFGGSPYGGLVGDYEWGKGPEDIDLLSRISNVAAAAHAPFITAPSPELFDLESWDEIGRPRDLAKVFDRADYTAWNSFRDSDDSRYVGMCLPRFLSRLPYGSKTKKIEAFNFEEGVDGTTHGDYCWSNAAYTFGARLTSAFEKHGWCVAVRGVQGGGLVEGLPTHNFKTDEGEVAMKCPTEIAITDRREAELYKMGFMPLLHCKGKDYAAFFGAQSAHRPKKWDTPAANANEQLSAQLPYLMATSRFAHYLKAMVRDWVGGFAERDEVEKRLNRWISNYVLLTEGAGQEIKAKFPLREARIDVKDIPGKPGHYTAVAYLRPHFQLEEIDVSLRLVAELPTPAGG
ncbi:MAG: type VI secretion system contractile sheath large subunit [Planctomycetes bacterium]|nr:type VI secretion system contractile sheath large subunit [Planctomycetota bacterium]